MILLPSLLVLLATVSFTNAHIEFIRIAHNGVWQSPLRYIRNRTSPWQEADLPGLSGYRQWTFPTFPSDALTSVRCGRDSLSWASQTETLKVKAGDEVEFLAFNAQPLVWDDTSEIQWEGCPDGRGGCIPEAAPSFGYYAFRVQHEGPASVFISRVPDGQDITGYDGSAEWQKIKTWGVEFRNEGVSTFWLPNQQVRLKVNLPRQTPAGKYLLRIDQIWPGSISSSAQHYPACAHIEVEDNPSSNPLPAGVKIPEILCPGCPGKFSVPSPT
ncbi:hypothetical protein P154DRAFT_579997 [Amniculicola lignicola CBS 123094]|uniref:lytic cellulose monooxygenase (C4-dehydrogenating) n=1 Tax=Amniculicola lignicola CBS 123094 TaxID=1392246 RepID=A0A6A5W8H1_9PLEO|nr:hypothetical protein P154DRAFT_579997 [Amniculicola lignicola CBS 123094]